MANAPLTNKPMEQSLVLQAASSRYTLPHFSFAESRPPLNLRKPAPTRRGCVPLERKRLQMRRLYQYDAPASNIPFLLPSATIWATRSVLCRCFSTPKLDISPTSPSHIPSLWPFAVSLLASRITTDTLLAVMLCNQCRDISH